MEYVPRWRVFGQFAPPRGKLRECKERFARTLDESTVAIAEFRVPLAATQPPKTNGQVHTPLDLCREQGFSQRRGSRAASISVALRPGRSARERPLESAASPLASGTRRTADTSLPSSSSRAFARHRSRCARRRVCASSQSGSRIRLQIHGPARMSRRATLRADDDVFPIQLLVEKRQRPELAGLRAARDEEQRRQRAWSAANRRIPQMSLLGIRKIEFHMVPHPPRHSYRELFELFLYRS